MKTKEELNALKNEVETLSVKLSELTDEELQQVVGGFGIVENFKGKFKYVSYGNDKAGLPGEYDEQIISGICGMNTDTEVH